MPQSRPSRAGRLLRIGLRAIGLIGATILVALLGLRHLVEVGHSLDRLADARIATAATAGARTLDDDFGRFARMAQGVGAADVQGDRLALTARLLRMQIALPGTSEVFAATAAGRVIAASDPLPATAPDLAQQGWFAAALQGPASSMSIALAAPDTAGWIHDGPSLMLTVPVVGASGQVVGLVGAALRPAEVRRVLDRAPLPPGAGLRLVDTGNTLLAATDVAAPPSTSSASGVEPARLIARIALRDAPATLSVSAPLHVVPARIVASMPQIAAWSSGWPELRGEVAGFALELLGLWAVLAILLLPRGWRGGRSAAPATSSAAPATAAAVGAAVGPGTMAPAVLPPGVTPIRPSDRTAFVPQMEGAASRAEARAQAAEAALAESRDTMETIRRDQELALAGLGHDMRTPMQSVLGICDLLLDGALEDDQRHWVEQLRASGTALVSLLNGLLALAGGAAAQAEATDLVALLQEAVALFAAQAEGKRISLVARLDPALRGTWRVDAARVRRIVVNLLANAVSRTSFGGVELHVAPERAADGRTMIRIVVADTGPGIAPQDHSRIFERFERADAPSRGAAEGGDQDRGLGLGLALCRENARALGGTLTLDSRLGDGAAFTLLCPADPDLSEGDTAAFAGRAALVVGLAEAPQAALRDRLAQLGFAVETAADGYVGLAVAERTVALHGVLDLVVADLGVTGMAADSFCLRLRGTSFGKSLVLVGLTDEVQALRPPGVDALLARGAPTAEIVAAASALIAEQPALSVLLPTGAAAGGGRVLVVEDDETNRALLGAALARSGFTAFPAANGEEALRMAEHDGLDAVLLDLLLPGIDGIETARRIRDLPGRSASIPIIALTARADATVQAECRTAGVTALVTKPADLDRLTQRLRGWIAAAPRGAGSGPGVEENVAASPVAVVSGPFLEAMVSEIGIERTRACVQEFLDETGAKCVRLAELIPGWEAGAVLRLCDDLKGLADLFGAVGFSEVIEDLAAAVTSGAREPASDAMARLEAGLPALPEAIWACLSRIERRRAERGRRAA
jgi:signal transduction histidine kinase/CheY-like chemotaxis protein